MTTENEENEICQTCGKKKLKKSECHEYENYDFLCEDCLNDEEEMDDFPVIF